MHMAGNFCNDQMPDIAGISGMQPDAAAAAGAALASENLLVRAMPHHVLCSLAVQLNALGLLIRLRRPAATTCASGSMTPHHLHVAQLMQCDHLTMTVVCSLAVQLNALGLLTRQGKEACSHYMRTGICK